MATQVSHARILKPVNMPVTQQIVKQKQQPNLDTAQLTDLSRHLTSIQSGENEIDPAKLGAVLGIQNASDIEQLKRGLRLCLSTLGPHIDSILTERAKSPQQKEDEGWENSIKTGARYTATSLISGIGMGGLYNLLMKIFGPSSVGLTSMNPLTILATGFGGLGLSLAGNKFCELVGKIPGVKEIPHALLKGCDKIENAFRSTELDENIARLEQINQELKKIPEDAVILIRDDHQPEK